MKILRIKSRTAGFSLIEIMVVVVILGILAAIVVPKFINRPEQARLVKAKQDILAVQESLDLYKLDNGFYPSTDQGLRALINRPSSQPAPLHWRDGGYLARVPLDPWGREYQYLNPGVHNTDGVDIFTFGPNGLPESTDTKGIIGNWNIDETG